MSLIIHTVRFILLASNYASAILGEKQIRMSINFELHPKQTFVLETEATEILYGGAAGGGKSHLLRVIAILLLIYIPNIQIYLFRRLSPDLQANHMDGESGFRNILASFVLAGDIRIVEDEIRHKNGGKIHLCHCQYEKDRFKYQGAEMHVLLIDELTHFTDIIYRFLRNRVRMPPAIPKIIYQIFGPDFTLPKIICGSNPGNVGHTFVKNTFVDMLKPFEVKKMTPEEGGMLRQYIPALLEDNPSLMLNDPGYELRLEGLGSPDLVKAMRYGLWDITAGAALEKLRRDKHMIRDFQVPETWTKFMVIDWGSSKPFCVAWFCVVDDDMVLKAKGEWEERLIPRGALIAYREWYGWNGKANEGARLESPVVAKQIMDIEEEAGEEMDYRVGDTAMWSEHDGKSVQERMYDATEGRFLMEKSKKDRQNNFEEIRTRIAGDEDGPMFYATVGCKHFWRTVPDLQLDDRSPEKGPDTEQEDHWYDCLSYGCASRPFITTRKERLQAAIQEAKRQARKNS